MGDRQGSLRITLGDRQLKMFRNALQSLHKIGPELMIEAHPSRLCLRVINSSRSSYMSVSLSDKFFDAYDVFDCNVTQAVVLFKHVLSVFRTQRVDKIVLELKTEEARVTMTLHCENGLLKSYKFPTIEGEVLQATADRSTFPVCVVAETGAMNKLLSAFHSSLSEVTITAQAEGATAAASAGKSVQLRSYIDPTKAALDESLHTMLSLDAALTFVSYTHTCDEAVEATFNVKDFRAMLGLCDSLGCQIKLLFQGPGDPLVAEPHFAGHHDAGVEYEAELIVATLTGAHEPMPSQPANERYGAAPGRANNANPAHAAAGAAPARGQQGGPSYSGLEDAGDIDAAAADMGLGEQHRPGGYDEVPSTPPEEQGPGATMPGVIAVSFPRY